MLKTALSGHWTLVRAHTTQRIPATVPGCVHTDLLAADKIEDPFFRENEKTVKWIGEAGWTYSRDFVVDELSLIHI